jgi:hypothetical protein
MWMHFDNDEALATTALSDPPTFSEPVYPLLGGVASKRAGRLEMYYETVRYLTQRDEDPRTFRTEMAKHAPFAADDVIVVSVGVFYQYLIVEATQAAVAATVALFKVGSIALAFVVCQSLLAFASTTHSSFLPSFRLQGRLFRWPALSR